MASSTPTSSATPLTTSLTSGESCYEAKTAKEDLGSASSAGQAAPAAVRTHRIAAPAVHRTLREDLSQAASSAESGSALLSAPPRASSTDTSSVEHAAGVFSIGSDPGSAARATAPSLHRDAGEDASGDSDATVAVDDQEAAMEEISSKILHEAGGTAQVRGDGETKVKLSNTTPSPTPGVAQTSEGDRADRAGETVSSSTARHPGIARHTHAHVLHPVGAAGAPPFGGAAGMGSRAPGATQSSTRCSSTPLSGRAINRNAAGVLGNYVYSTAQTGSGNSIAVAIATEKEARACVRGAWRDLAETRRPTSHGDA